MQLPINDEEFKELMEALNESNHPDVMKRQFRNELHKKLRITTSNNRKDYDNSGTYTKGFSLLSHVGRNLFTYINFSKILGSFQ